MPVLKHCYPIWMILLSTACGGGGGSNAVDLSESETVLSGQFIDSPVSGIRYETETRSGTTDANGQFKYLEGEIVNLYIGDLFLGEAPGATTITLFDLVDGVNPVLGNELETLIGKRKRGPSLSTVVNLATLLQTLDSDGNPDNGIEITADVAALFAADSIDIDQYWEDFPREFGLRKAIAEAKSSDFLDSARQVRKPWRALAHVYASLGIDSKLRAISSIRTDNNRNSSRSYVYNYTFDAEGKLTRREKDEGIDGTLEHIDVYTYDDNGNLTAHEYDDNGDVTPDDITSYTYDAYGNSTGSVRDSDFDGSPDQIRIRRYDIWGNQTHYEWHDYPQGRTSFSSATYDADGRYLREEHDTDGSGSPNRIETWTYESNGYRMETEHSLYGQPGSILSIFDSDGKLLRKEEDHENDGILNRLDLFFYDAKGNEIRHEGTVTTNRTSRSLRTKTYDDDSNLMQEVVFFQSSNNKYTSDYNTNGNLIRYASDHNGDDIADFIETFTYDTYGNLVKSEEAYGENITPATILAKTLSYDEHGNLLRSETDSSSFGVPDENETWTYSADTQGWWRIFNPTSQ